MRVSEWKQLNETQNNVNINCSDHPALHGLWYLTGATTFAAAVSYIVSKDTYKIIKESRKIKEKTKDNKHAA